MKDYFSHDYNSRNDKKLVKAGMKFDLCTAIGAYWCIVEMLYEEGGYLLLSEYERITYELRCSNELVNYLILDSELFKNDGVRFWSETAIKRLKLRAAKSQKARESIENRWNRLKDTNVLPTNNDRNTSKVKESKVKVNNTILSFDEFWNLYDKKVGDKKKLEKKYENISESDRELIKAHIPAYIASQPDKKYRKDPQTYLNNYSWNDEIITNNTRSYGTEIKPNQGHYSANRANNEDIFCGVER